MATLVTSYEYSLQTTVIIKNKTYDITSNSIKSLTVSHDYDKNTMPSVYIGVNISSQLYNEMVANADTGIISLRVFRSVKDQNNAMQRLFFEDRFMYVMPSDPNYRSTLSDMDKETNTTDQNYSTSYLSGYIGLISLRCVEDNKKMFNEIVKNTDLISVVHKYTNHMNMCIEPFDQQCDIDQFIIPPITSITSLLAYLNDTFCFYKEGYRFFRDFDVSYLLSMKGKHIDDKRSIYNTVIISVRDPLEQLSNTLSMELDNKNKAYIVYVNATDTSIKVNRILDKQFNSIMGVNTLGEVLEEELDIPRSPESSKKVLLERVNSDNLTTIYNTKHKLESSAVIMQITKSEIDSSILTPNKEFQIRNYPNNAEYNGRYVLSYKKEVMFNDGDKFRGTVVFGLRKVEE